MTTTDDRPTLAPAPCPSWCLGPHEKLSNDDHDGHTDATGTLTRHHDAFRGEHVSVDVEERRGPDGVTFKAPRIYGPDMSGQFIGERHTPELLRAFADELRSPAAVLEQVKRLHRG